MKYTSHLQEMMVELRNCYEANDGLTLESVIKGKFYADKISFSSIKEIN